MSIYSTENITIYTHRNVNCNKRTSVKYKSTQQMWAYYKKTYEDSTEEQKTSDDTRLDFHHRQPTISTRSPL